MDMLNFECAIYFGEDFSILVKENVCLSPCYRGISFMLSQMRRVNTHSLMRQNDFKQ